MKITEKVEKEIDVAAIYILIPVRYEEEDIPNNFPLRKGDVWEATVDVDTGQIKDWPKGKSGKMYMKVCDGGIYKLFDRVGDTIGAIIHDYVPCRAIPGDYVPCRTIPGDYGDYIDLKINADGVITNWHKNPDFAAFF